MNLSTTVFALATLGLGSASVYLYTELDTARGRADAEAALRLDQEAHLQALEASRLDLERQLQALLAANRWSEDSISPPDDGETLAQAPASRGAEEPPERESGRERRGMFAGARNAFRNRLSTPEGRAAMAARQKMGLRVMYKDLAAELNLNADQAGQLIDLLAEQQIKQMQQLQESNGDRQALTDLQRENEVELMATLGDKYLQYEDYRQTMGERTQVEQLGVQFAASNIPLNASQEKQLFSAMVQERKSTPAPIWSTSLSPQENMAQQRKWQQDYNTRVRESVAGVLSADQLKQYEEMQKTQSGMFRGGGAIRGFMGGGGRRGGPNIMVMPAQGAVTVTR